MKLRWTSLDYFTPRTWRFWGKTLLHRYTPGGYGYIRYLRQQHDPTYVHAQDKHPVREKHHGAEGWHEEVEAGIRKRDYADYEEYTVHQKQKFDEMLKIKGGFSNEAITLFRLRFFQRFRYLSRLLPKSAVIVCAGARQGTEVEVLRDLGFYNAYGIDLNPGPNNPYVRTGDFMQMAEATNSIDVLYTNCVDHAFDLDAFFAEHKRVIKPNGYVLYDIASGEMLGLGAFEAVTWDDEMMPLSLMLKHFRRLLHADRDGEWTWLLWQGKKD